MNLDDETLETLEEDDSGICPFDNLPCDNHRQCCVDHPVGDLGEGWFSFCKRNIDRKIGVI